MPSQPLPRSSQRARMTAVGALAAATLFGLPYAGYSRVRVIRP